MPDHEALPVRAGSAGHPGGRGGAGLSGKHLRPGDRGTVEPNLWVGTARAAEALSGALGMGWTPPEATGENFQTCLTIRI